MKKKIAHVTFDMHIGGAEQVIYNLIENTDHSKYDLSVLCLNQPVGPFGRQLQEKGYKITAFNRRPGFDLLLIRDMHRFVKGHNVQVLHCHQYTPYIYGLFSTMFTKVKVIFTEHGRFYPDQRKIKRALLNPYLNMFTDYVTAISSATRDALVKFENFPEGKIKIIYNGIEDSKFLLPEDTGLRQALGIDSKAHVLGTVARLDPIKNQQMMIKSLSIVMQRYRDTFLIIIGDGPEKDRLKSLASKLGLSSRVIFTGFREDVHRYLKIFDIFLLTSLSEGTAITLLEAMASSLPCIVTDVGGNSEIVMDKEYGFVIPNNEEKALAEKICILLSNKELMEKMGQGGRKRFEEKYAVDKMVKAYEELYDGKR